MKNFRWTEPQTIEQAVAWLAKEEGKAYPMAGGTDIFAEIKEGVVEPELIIDLKAIPGLSYIQKDKDGVRIGALTTVADLAADTVIRQDYPGLSAAASSLATPQLRNIGTVGGNLCQRPRCWYYRDVQSVCRKKGGSRCFASRGKNKYHAIFGGGICHIAYPSDLAPALIALDAQITIRSPRGEKRLALADFYALPSKNVRRENVLAADELVREVHLPPVKENEKSAYIKLKERETWDFALVSAAVRGTVSGGRLNAVRIVLGGVAPIPWRLADTESSLRGKELTNASIKEALQADLLKARPLQENGYKTALVEAAVSQALMSLA
ncbi:MAG: xanthine dehydrogenase family protein subunit M [Candidatus Aminicenantes bacterium]|nr:xanthine dehydrogenase family protein subunit M [Candidatus Aminicenantes bacterium]